METIRQIADLRQQLDRRRCAGAIIGFVPTMGYLHDGHVSLIRAARDACDVVVVSIFVNPLQFGPSEDLADYPRDLDRDSIACAAAETDIVFVPTVEEMYPRGLVATRINVSGVASRWEAASRPTHFQGVATVVAKLFSIVGPCRAYFGEKDFQQLAVVRQMVHDLSLTVEVVGCPTVREPDGLAMSSRNEYLQPDERLAATALHRALQRGREAVASGEVSPEIVARSIASVATADPLVHLDYVGVVDPETLEVPEKLDGESRLLIAARVGRARLIDNIAAP